MHRRPTAVAAALSLLLTCGVAPAARQAQPPRDTRAASPAPPVGTAAVTGAVVVAGSGLPARKARVSLSGGQLRVSRTATTDEHGRFSFLNLPAGRYALSASKPGHVAVTYGQRQPGSGRPGTPIELTDGQKLEARLQLPKGGVITGTVVDELGEPAPGTQVRVLRYASPGGTRTLQNTTSATTDDRGVFRAYGLQPGDYVVCATPRNSSSDGDRLQQELASLRAMAAEMATRDRAQAGVLTDRAATLQAELGQADEATMNGYAPVCYPGTTVVTSAAPVALGVGEERAGIDFQLQMVPMARVEGIVLNPGGTSVQNIQVSLVATSDIPGYGTPTTRPDAEGRFRLPYVAPGQYRLVARATVRPTQAAPPPQGPGQGRAAMVNRAPQGLWASADVSIDGRNLSNVTLTLQPGITITGQMTFEGATAPPTDLTRARVSLSPVAAPGILREMTSGSTGRVEANGRFTISNVMPGRYRLDGSAGASGWSIESAIVGGQDTTDFPIDIKGDQAIAGATLTFTDRQSELSGALVDERGQPATGYTVIVFPADQRFWTPGARRIQAVRPATNGAFAFRSLPPGDYRLATVVDPEPGSWYDPAFLQQLDAATLRVSIAAGEKKVQNLRVPGS